MTKLEEIEKLGPLTVHATEIKWLINRVKKLTDLLSDCRERLDDADGSDELWILVNQALEDK